MDKFPTDRFVDIGFKMHLREWGADSAESTNPTILLVHGLSSNASTWDGVARELADAGYHAVAIDQRGHGLSDKPPVEDGYDFATVSADIARLIAHEGWQLPVIAGQSWGGNVMLALGASHPGLARGFIWVDGGFFDVKQRAPIWEDAYEMFKPPAFGGVARSMMAERMRIGQPEWSDEGIEGTLANFETLPDGTIQPWLTLDRHMAIFRAMWEQNPPSLYPLVREPVLVCAAGDSSTDDKRVQVDQAGEGLANREIHWFKKTAHDIHVHRPKKLAKLILKWMRKKQLNTLAS